MLLHALLTFAAGGAEASRTKTPFYILGGLLAVWAVVVVGCIGMRATRRSRRPRAPRAA